MRHSLVLMCAVIAATWHAWRWYLLRITSAPEEGAALALTILLILACGWREREAQAFRAAVSPPIWTAGLLLALYAAGFGLLPPIARAAFAVAATLLCLFTALFGRRPPVAFWGLVALSLPVLPSLQFTLGYGLRVISAALTVYLLRAQGLDVAQQGTFLLWQGETLQFDAPCSGVNMLWAGLLVALLGALAQNFRPWRTAAAVAVGIVITLAGNVLRAASLFFIESGLLRGLPAWGHEAVGVAAFLFAVIGLLWTLHKLEPARAPANRSQTA